MRPVTLLTCVLAAGMVHGGLIAFGTDELPDGHSRTMQEKTDRNVKFDDSDMDEQSLLQTDVAVTPKIFSNERENYESSSAKGFWKWLTQAENSEHAVDASEASKRFHKDFIVAALLICSVLPWSHIRRDMECVHADEGKPVGNHCFWQFLPSSQSSRFASVLLLWLKHYLFKGPNLALEVSLVLAGALLDCAGERGSCDNDLWNNLSACVPARIVCFFPLYALHVIVCYLAFFSFPGNNMESIFGVNSTFVSACGVIVWLLSVAFACYLVFPAVAIPARNAQTNTIVMISAGCVAMVVLPRTLAAPVHGPWALSGGQTLMQSNPDASIPHMLFFARRSLLNGLAHFFFGIVLARVCAVARCSSWRRRHVAGPHTQPAPERLGTASQDMSKPEADMWRAFGDEAMRDMLGSFTVNMTGQLFDSGPRSPSLSPRSNRSD